MTSPSGSTSYGERLSRTPVTKVDHLDRRRASRIANVVVKAALFASFAIALFAPIEALEGKAMEFRAPVFLAPAVVLPLLGLRWAKSWRKLDGYPHLGDALLASPFLLDTLGNLGGFYDRYDGTDDVLHFVNWVLLVAAFCALRFRVVPSRREAVFIGTGFGALAIVLWEIGEWFVSDAGPFAGDVPDALSLTYADTVGDLAISTGGGLVGALLATWLLGWANLGTASAD